MPTFMLRMTKPEDEDLWNDFKEKCAAQGRPARWVMIALIKQFIAGKVKV